jgi:hypothetical protein
LRRCNASPSTSLGGRLFRLDDRAYGLGADSVEKVVYLPDRNILGVGSEDPAARFILGESFQRRSRAHQLDLQRNLQSVHDARRMADWVVFSMHSHEGGNLEEEPADHIRDLAHADRCLR